MRSNMKSYNENGEEEAENFNMNNDFVQNIAPTIDNLVGQLKNKGKSDKTLDSLNQELAKLKQINEQIEKGGNNDITSTLPSGMPGKRIES